MKSLREASEMACPMVLQAVCGDLQSLWLLPFTPSTYHLLLARAVGRTPNNVSTAKQVSFRDFIFPPIDELGRSSRLNDLRSIVFAERSLLNTLAACVSVL